MKICLGYSSPQNIWWFSLFSLTPNVQSYSFFYTLVVGAIEVDGQTNKICLHPLCKINHNLNLFTVIRENPNSGWQHLNNKCIPVHHSEMETKLK